MRLNALLLILWFITGLPTAASADDSLTHIKELERGIARLEDEHGEFHLVLFDPLMQLAEANLQDGNMEGALDLFQRAQHISHRNEGVYSPRQLEIIRRITNIALMQGEFDQADRQQRFAFFVESHHLEDQTDALLVAYDSMADWFMFTGQPRRARRLLQEALEIAEQDDRNPLPLAVKINKSRRLEGICCRAGVLEDAIARSTGADGDLLSTAYLELADAYILTGKPETARQWYRRAHEAAPISTSLDPKPISNRRKIPDQLTHSVRTYRLERNVFSNRPEPRRVWERELLEDETRKPQWFIIDGDEEQIGFIHRDIRTSEDPYTEPEQLVGYPILFQEDQVDNLLSRRLSSRKEDLTVTLTFDILASGDLENIEVASSNAPNKINRLVIDALRKVYFRPALRDGIPVETTGYQFTQTFKTFVREV